MNAMGIVASARAIAPTGGGGGDYAAEVLADSPVLYWPFGEASGTTAADASGNGQDGTIAGGALGATGIPDGGTAIQFNGTSGQRVIRESASGLPTSGPFTIEFWHKTSVYVNLSQVFGFGPTLPTEIQTYGRYTLQFNNHYYFWGMGEASDWDSGVTWDADSQWHHIAWVNTGSTLMLYRDGVLAANRGSVPSLSIGPTTAIAGGQHSAGSTPQMSLAHCAIFASALGADRIAAHYAAGI